MATLEERLECAEEVLAKTVEEIDSIKAEMQERDEDPYPIGTVVKATGSWIPFAAIRFRNVPDYLQEYYGAHYSGPCWVTLFHDMSGRAYPTFADLRRAFDSGIDFVPLEVP
ncbi:hypothetical protein SEA_BRICOLE_40 [Mycobacterium phage Bricole]|uniref:Uncharacterized protein n=1 Tax=Mycobacterium phage Bricole TaxID=1718601 RepID=A0A0M4QUD0_9CAUD|nr:hypothetical protein SEA_BRICOLE_40 [Mycobacterium phage Bricole]